MGVAPWAVCYYRKISGGWEADTCHWAWSSMSPGREHGKIALWWLLLWGRWNFLLVPFLLSGIQVVKGLLPMMGQLPCESPAHALLAEWGWVSLRFHCCQQLKITHKNPAVVAIGILLFQYFGEWEAFLVFFFSPCLWWIWVTGMSNLSPEHMGDETAFILQILKSLDSSSSFQHSESHYHCVLYLILFREAEQGKVSLHLIVLKLCRSYFLVAMVFALQCILWYDQYMKVSRVTLHCCKN